MKTLLYIALSTLLQVFVLVPRTAHAQNDQRRTVCGGHLRLNPSLYRNDNHRARALIDLAKSFRSIRERSRDVVDKFKTNFLLSGNIISNEDLDCVTQTVPQVDTGAITLDNISDALTECFTALQDMLSVVRIVKEHNRQLEGKIGCIERNIYKALCSLSYIGLGSGIILPNQIYLQTTTLTCMNVSLYRRFLMDREIFHRITTLADDLYDRFDTLRQEL